ncbi:MAG: AraC family transcriptional regulator [Lysinibacillus sp.]
MNYEAHMLLWEHTYVKLKKIERGNNAKIQIDKIMKHSTLLIITAGEAEIVIGEHPYQVQSFSIFHIGKAQTLHIKAKGPIHYFMIHYKGDVIYTDTFMQHLHMQHQPFKANFSCVPAKTLSIHLLLQEMYDEWEAGSIQEHLSVKASFYKLIYCIFQELADGQGKPHEMDKVEVARLYLERHIHKPISIQSLADSLEISTRHLLRLFKERYRIGPQIYLQQLRMERAKQHLLSNHYGIKEIALSLGYEDEYYFSRAFKKETSMAPSIFRRKYKSIMSENAITNENHFQYNENQLAKSILIENRGNDLMLKKLAAPFLLSLICLLAACGEDKSQHVDKEDTPKAEETSTRTVTDDSGRKVEIPMKPQRVVTDWYLGQILAVGMKPVMGNAGYAGFLEQYYNKGEILEIGDVQTSLEKIVELKPDIIITWDAEKVESYEKIAPTIVFGESKYKTAQEEILAMGEFLGREKEAKEFVKDFDKRIEVAKEKILNAVPVDSTFSLYQVAEKDAHVIANNSIAGGRAFYQILGMKPTPKIQELFDTKESDYGRYPISFETISDYEGDYVLVNMVAKNSGDLPPTWKSLNAVKNNKIIELDPIYYFPSDPLSSLHQAEEIAEKIVELTKSKQ